MDNRKKNKRNGYIAILLCLSLPVLLLGVKSVLDTMTKNKFDIEKGGDSELYKKCAREAALAVAKNWNPGLTLSQQKEAALKVADAVYNMNPCYNDSIIGESIPGLDIKKGYEVSSYSTLSGIVVSPQTIISTSKTIDYTTATKYTYRHNIYKTDAAKGATTWNPNYAMWRSIDKGTDQTNRVSAFDEVDVTGLSTGNVSLTHHDIYSLPCLMYIGDTCRINADDGLYYPNNLYHSPGCHTPEHALLCITIPSTVAGSIGFGYHPGSVFTATNSYSQSSSTYKKRISESDTTVQVSIDNDRIKVLTDHDVGYAIPAECNVDIVLAIPVSGSANNVNSRDAASDISETPPVIATTPTEFPTSATTVPMYQIGQACKNFVKNNFYHTRGVNVGLIPYSAKVSISPDKTSYVKDASTFVTSYFQANPLESKKMCGAALYYTRGEKNADLSAPYLWGTELVGYPIMCRRGATSTLTTYGNNPIAHGDLLSVTLPTAEASKFQRMNLNPCYIGYCNMLSLKCEKMCITFLPNPYYMIEPTADLVKIYEMCNALYPIYDLHNVSNFIFIPVTWANNFFQGWTNDPSVPATTNQLSRMSKTTSGRKKALILIVNKPDWFEPGELTYIGFDNDYSEFPTVESDKIGFDINYDDTTERFLDGSNYNTNHTSGTYIGTNNTGLIAGPKKILKFSKYSGDEIVRRNGFYESDYSTCRLTFPQKGLLKLTVAPASSAQSGGGTGKVTFYTDNIGSTYDVRKDSTSGTPITLGSEISVAGTQKFVFSGALAPTSSSHTLTRGANFSHNLSVKKVKYNLENATIVNCVLRNQFLRNYISLYGTNNKQLIKSDETLSETDNNNYYATSINTDDAKKLYRDSCISVSGGQYSNTHIHLHSTGASYVTTNIIYGVQNVRCFYYGDVSNLNVLLLTGSNSYTTFTLAPATWGNTILSAQSYYTDRIECKMQPGGGCIYQYQYYIANIDDKTLQGTIVSDPIAHSSLVLNTGIYLYTPTASDPNSGWICFQGDGELEVSVTGGCGLQFHNVSSNSSLHEIKGTETFYVEPSQISNTKDADGNYYVEFTAGALKLISAEITNREYEKITPTCYLQGATNSLKTTGTAYIITNVKEKMTINAKTSQPDGYITFYSDNIGNSSDVRLGSTTGTKINLDTQQTIANSQTFVFSGANIPPGNNSSYNPDFYGSTYGANFSGNLSKYKVRYSLDDAEITDCTVKNQVLRFYGTQYFDSSLTPYGGVSKKTPLTLNDGTTISARPATYAPTGYYDPFPLCKDTCIKFQNNKSYVENDSLSDFAVDIFGTNKINKAIFSQRVNNTLYYKISDGSEKTYQNSSSWIFNVFDTSSYTSYYSDHIQLRTPTKYSWNLMQIFIVNSLSKDFISNITDDDILYNRGVGLMQKSGQDWICFQGDGELEVTVRAKANPVGSIKYTKADRSGTGMHIVTTSDSYTTLTIDPETHLYEGNADGSFYVIRLDLDNIALDSSNGVAFVSTPSQIYQFKKIDTSSNFAKRGINYSNVTTSHDSNFISGSLSTFYNILRGTHGISSNSTGKSIYTIAPRTLWGDITHITDDYGSSSAYMNVTLGSDYDSHYHMPGCVRIFSPILRGSTFKYLTCTEKSGINYTKQGGAADLLATEITYPINHILYNGGYQLDINTTPTGAAANVTAAACQKLKSDFGTNVRIYVIKYRKQLKYKSFPFQGVSQTDIDHDYSTVDACASGTGAPYIYDISTETELKESLNSIANNIKKSDFANLKNAKNVE